MIFKQCAARLQRIHVSIWILGIFIGIGMTILQAWFMGDLTVYVGTVFLTFSLFAIAVKYENVYKKENWISYIGKNLSEYVYLLHIAIFDVIKYIYKITWGERPLIF